MHNRIHFRKKIKIFRRPKKRNIIIFITISILISIIFIFNYINKKISPTLLSYAELEAKKLLTIVINSAVSENISNNEEIDNLFLVSKDSNGQISTIDFNPTSVNKLLTLTTSTIQEKLKRLEEGNINNIEGIDYLSDSSDMKKGIVFQIPSGLVFGNAFFSNLGPYIPVKLNVVGDILSEITTKVTNYGINNALIEIRINIALTQQVILPIISNKIEIDLSIPIALKLIQGTVPNYYLNGLNQNSNSLSLPTE